MSLGLSGGWKTSPPPSFMEAFYRGMNPELTGYAHALRAAKLRLLRSDKWHHPYYWAPFVLYGEAPTLR